MCFKGGISGGIEKGGKKLSGRTVKKNWDLKTYNELSMSQEPLFPSMKKTSFRLRMSCPVFPKVILEESSAKGELI